MSTTYFGILIDGHIIEHHSLGEVSEVEDVEYILKCVKSSEWSNPPTFTILNADGSRRKLVVGGFEVIDIGEQSPGTQAVFKTILIKDLRTGIRFQVETNKSGIAFFKDELIPVLNKLNEVGSWEMYQKLNELELAYKEIEQLKSKISELEAQLAER